MITSGEFVLKRQADGRGAYAHVRVEVRPDGPGGAHWPALPAESAEVRAALDGIGKALADLADCGTDTEGRSVHVTFFGYTVVDTEPTAVRAAATVAAFGAADRFALSYDGGWRYGPVDSSGG